MKVIVLYVESGKEEYVALAQEVYSQKIKRFSDFEYIKIKSPNADRHSSDYKIKEEAKLILKSLNEKDYVILLDENGEGCDSLQLSKKVASLATQKRVVFVVGGAFGVSQDIKKRANYKLSLSKMVMNHHIAQIVILEQIYRSFTIINKIPYHNG